jgi:hypothetical protein
MPPQTWGRLPDRIIQNATNSVNNRACDFAALFYPVVGNIREEFWRIAQKVRCGWLNGRWGGDGGGADCFNFWADRGGLA